MRTDRVDQLLTLDGERFVRACYQTLLGRDPDESGFNNYLAELIGGREKHDIVLAFITSEEGRRNGIHNRGVAQVLLRSLLGKYAVVVDAKALDRRLAALIDYLDNPLPPSGDGSIEWTAPAPSGDRSPEPLPLFVVTARPAEEGRRGPNAAVWYDMTALFGRPDRERGQIRAELELARLMRLAEPGLGFLVRYGDLLLEIDAEQIAWLFDETFIADAFVDAFAEDGTRPARPLRLFRADGRGTHACNAGDIVISWATLGEGAGDVLRRPGEGCSAVRLCHVVSQTTIDAGGPGETRRRRHLRYLEWLSAESNMLLAADAPAFAVLLHLQKEGQWSSPPSKAVDGLQLLPWIDPEDARAIIAEIGLTGNFALNIDFEDPSCNLDTLYRAWILAGEMGVADLPLLVVVEPSQDRGREVLEEMLGDPRLAGTILALKPSDRLLAALLRQAAMVVCTSTSGRADQLLLDLVGKGRACIAAKSVAGDQPADPLLTCVEPVDVRGWANAIVDHASCAMKNCDADRIRHAGRVGRSDRDSVAALKHALAECHAAQVAGKDGLHRPISVKPTIWMDLTLTFLEWTGSITGIVRAELAYAYYLRKVAPDTRYFAFVRGRPGYFFEIERPLLAWLFDAVDLSDAYRDFSQFWANSEASGTVYRDPFRVPGKPVPGHPAYIERFPANSVLFFAAIDQDGTGELSRCREVLKMVDRGSASMTSQLIYDLTPFLMPQVHHEYTVRGYMPFVKFVSDHFDHLVYGGRTAQTDALDIQHDRGWRSPRSDFVEFGSDLALAGDATAPPLQRSRRLDHEKLLLERLGITGAFLITVGSLEPRKNHALLYHAYVELLERGSLDEDVQLVFVGRKGWKIDGLLATIAADERVRGKLLIVGPSDEELEALYFNCRFTLLPSFYEGWSLTLPESFSYGKFCLTSDVMPLREIAGDLAEYIHPLDTLRWADRIEHYLRNPRDVASWEVRIRQEWHPRSWLESTQMLVEKLHQAHAARFPY